MPEVDHVGKTIEAAADAAVADTIAYVRQHPQYGQIVQALGDKAIQALLAGL